MNILWDEFVQRLYVVAVSSQVHNTGLGCLPVMHPAFFMRVILSWIVLDWIAPGFMQ